MECAGWRRFVPADAGSAGLARDVVVVGAGAETAVVAGMAVVTTGAVEGLEEDAADTDGASSSSSRFRSSEISTLAGDIVFCGGCMRIICASSEGVGVLFCGALQWDQNCEAQRTEYLCTPNRKILRNCREKLDADAIKQICRRFNSG